MKMAYERTFLVNMGEPQSKFNINGSPEGAVLIVEHEGHKISVLIPPELARQVGVGIIEMGALASAELEKRRVAAVQIPLITSGRA